MAPEIKTFRLPSITKARWSYVTVAANDVVTAERKTIMNRNNTIVPLIFSANIAASSCFLSFFLSFFF